MKLFLEFYELFNKIRLNLNTPTSMTPKNNQRILQLTAPGTPAIVKQPLTAPNPGQALIQVIQATPKLGTESNLISGKGIFVSRDFNKTTRLFEDRHTRPEDRFPINIGSQFYGKIIEIGSEVQDLELGELVYGWGAIADYHVVDASSLIKLGGLDPCRAFLMDPGQFAMGGIIDGAVKAGDNILVTGVGPIGLLTTALASEMGANVWVSCTFEEGRRLAKKFGAVEVINYNKKATGHYLKKNIKSRDGYPGVDVAIECSGKIRKFESCVQAVRQRGTVVVVGFYQEPATGWFPGEEAFHNAIDVRFSLPAFAFGNTVRSNPPMKPAELKEKVLDAIRDLNAPVEEIIKPMIQFGPEAVKFIENLGKGIRDPQTIKPTITFD